MGYHCMRVFTPALSMTCADENATSNPEEFVKSILDDVVNQALGTAPRI